MMSYHWKEMQSLFTISNFIFTYIYIHICFTVFRQDGRSFFFQWSHSSEIISELSTVQHTLSQKCVRWMLHTHVWFRLGKYNVIQSELECCIWCMTWWSERRGLKCFPVIMTALSLSLVLFALLCNVMSKKNCKQENRKMSEGQNGNSKPQKRTLLLVCLIRGSMNIESKTQLVNFTQFFTYLNIINQLNHVWCLRF